MKRNAGYVPRFKLTAFAVALVLFVVVAVSAPLYVIMARAGQEAALTGLRDRAAVLLDSLASGVRAFLPGGDVLHLGLLPGQSAAIPEARYVTITGYDDTVWASNDPDIISKIDTEEFRPGVSRLTDSLTPRLQEIAGELNAKAAEQAGELSAGITSLAREGIALALNTDEAGRRRLEDIRASVNAMEARLNETLAALAGIGSRPEFSAAEFDRGHSGVFMFYKPVLYRQGGDDTYFRGLVRLEVSAGAIIAQLNADHARLFRIFLLVDLAAFVLGVIAACILSSVIVRKILC